MTITSSWEHILTAMVRGGPAETHAQPIESWRRRERLSQEDYVLRGAMGVGEADSTTGFSRSQTVCRSRFFRDFLNAGNRRTAHGVHPWTHDRDRTEEVTPDQPWGRRDLRVAPIASAIRVAGRGGSSPRHPSHGRPTEDARTLDETALVQSRRDQL